MRQQEGCGQVDADDALPLAGIIVINAAEIGCESGAVGQSVETPEGVANKIGGIDEIGLGGVLQIQRQDRGFGMAAGDDGIINRLQIGFPEGGQNDGCPLSGAGECNRAANAFGGAGDEDDTRLESGALE